MFCHDLNQCLGEAIYFLTPKKVILSSPIVLLWELAQYHSGSPYFHSLNSEALHHQHWSAKCVTDILL